jgi:FdhE protein
VTSRSDACRQVLGARIARARALAASRPASAEVLTYYAAVAAMQRDLVGAAAVDADGLDVDASAADALRSVIAAVSIVPILERLIAAAPPRVAATLVPLRALSADDWQDACADVAQAPTGAPRAAGSAVTFVAEATLQPFAEVWASGAGPLTATADALRCPRCGGRAVAAVLRERGHGAARLMVCGFCATEWSVPRVVCPACGESRVEALPVFRDGAMPELRVDACDTCRVYIKAVDLTVDGHAVAVVDDLATLPLDLWAAAQGYTRPRPSLLRF